MGNLGLQWGPTAALVAASGYLLLLILAVRRRGLSGATERWFAAYLVLSAVWTVAWAFATQWGWIKPWIIDLGDSLAVYGAALLLPMLAVLTFHFLPRRGAREVAILGLVWVIAVVLVERSVVNAPQSSMALDFVRFVGWTGFVVGSIAMTSTEYARLRRPLHRNRVLYWLVALILVGLGDGIFVSGIAIGGLPPMNTLRFQIVDGGGCSLTGQIRLQGGNDHEDGQKRPAYGRGGVELLGDRDNLHVLLLDKIQEIEKVLR